MIIKGRPHARIMCEIAMTRSCADLKAKCELWMRQKYFLYWAMLWSHQAAPSPRKITVAGQPGVFMEEWNFGTIDYYNGLATACTGPDLLAYQVNIPVQDVFWSPSIIRGVPSTAEYVIRVPGGVTAPNFTIDLFQIQ
ncbi:hypothetical protein Glove_114g170 [Diversispora epigaea]|uniref:Uncharacterized protein n=1 Tax=Diversispora epigaea TaxID=1348612 RepID=A0A397JBB7_9GLOM|nr:hypothetical protein Glove_114g170 [Diversispora epigaea]